MREIPLSQGRVAIVDDEDFESLSQNGANRPKQQNNTSGLKGVSWSKKSQKWQVTIKHNGRFIHGGLFDEMSAAGRAYDLCARVIFGEFADVNFPQTTRLGR